MLGISHLPGHTEALMCIPGWPWRPFLGFSPHWSWLTGPVPKPLLVWQTSPGGLAVAQFHRPRDQPPCVGTLWTIALWGPAAPEGLLSFYCSRECFPQLLLCLGSSPFLSPCSFSASPLLLTIFHKATCFYPSSLLPWDSTTVSHCPLSVLRARMEIPSKARIHVKSSVVISPYWNVWKTLSSAWGKY